LRQAAFSRELIPPSSGVAVRLVSRIDLHLNFAFLHANSPIPAVLPATPVALASTSLFEIRYSLLHPSPLPILFIPLIHVQTLLFAQQMPRFENCCMLRASRNPLPRRRFHRCPEGNYLQLLRRAARESRKLAVEQ
jgi:hypothetical protein